MKSGFQTRLLAVLLGVFTLAACALAVANFLQESSTVSATDGVRWTETTGGLRAYMVPADTPGDHAGLRVGDVVTAINNRPTPNIAAVERSIFESGVYSTAYYSVLRSTPDGNLTPIEVQVYLDRQERTDFQALRLLALVYLAIGLYVLFRRWTAPKSTHFYVFCLVSFIFYFFHYTGVLDGLDITILAANIIAAALQPALFLHFAVSFSESERAKRLRFLYPLLYVPGATLAVLRWLSLPPLRVWSPTEILQHRLDKIDISYLVSYYILAAIVFWVRYRHEHQLLERQQLKWLTRGTLLTILPFATLYVIPFLADISTPVVITRVALFSLIFLPLTFSWAIVRYRLMDVDLIFKRGVSYTLATAAIVGLYFGAVALSANYVHHQIRAGGQDSEKLRDWALVAAVIIAGLVFDPLKRMIQNWVDRIFERKNLDYRETLIEFGRELNAQTDLRTLLNSIVERLPQTLLVTRIGVFLAQEHVTASGSRFTLVASHGLPPAVMVGSETLDLAFLDFDRRDTAHLFFESPHAMLRLPDAQRRAAAALDLNYYVPCRASRLEGAGMSTIAVLGLGRTGEGDFLSSEDMELLESLAGYIAIAIQNAQLYRRLEQKIFDFERLRDFNENIVESINIGVFAVDLNDCIESWNAQMEVMYATPRVDALRRHVSAVFSPELQSEFDRLRGEQGVATLYKFRLPTPTGEARTANITIAPLLNRNFDAVGRIIIVDDITDRINMETQLAQAEKLSSIGLLAAGVAHEVNTPLAVISSYAQMLSKQLLGNLDAPTHQRLQPVLEKITQQTFRASEIVNGLLNFSRLGSVEFAKVDVNAMVRDTVLLLEHQMRSSGVAVEMQLADGLPAIAGNRGKLQQVLVNLILNARDAMPPSNGRVNLSTVATSKGVEIRVADNGAGMPEEVVRKIYDPFFTTKSNPAEGQRKGTGLGLAVTYGIVQEHSGTIEVASTVGEGTVFRLEFPAVEGTPARHSDAQEGNIVHA